MAYQQDGRRDPQAPSEDGREDLFSLLKLKEYYEKELFEVAIIVCAPTGTPIRMLSFPDMMGWYMEKMINTAQRSRNQF